MSGNEPPIGFDRICLKLIREPYVARHSGLFRERLNPLYTWSWKTPPGSSGSSLVRAGETIKREPQVLGIAVPADCRRLEG